MRERIHSWMRQGAVSAAWWIAIGLIQGTAVSEQERGIEIAEIVGAEYLIPQGRFVLYATAGPQRSFLYPDDVARLALATSGCPSFGFSLDFARDGTAPFAPADFADPVRLARRILTEDDPICHHLRGRTRPNLRDLVAQAEDRPSRWRGVGRALGDLFNTTRTDGSLRELGLLSVEEIAKHAELLERAATDAAVSLRLNRRLLEDHFADEVVQSLQPRYVMSYMPAQCAPEIQRYLHSTHIESVLLATDAALKQIAYAQDLPPGLELGASQLFLCATEVEAWLKAGNTLESHGGGEFLLFLELVMQPEFADFPRVAVQFRNARIAVNTASRSNNPPPPCVDGFADALTTNMRRLMEHESTLGGEFRKLKNILLLHKALTWMQSLFVPVSAEVAASVPAPVFRNQPPLLQSFPMILSDGMRIRGVAYTGGIRLVGLSAPQLHSVTLLAGALRPASFLQERKPPNRIENKRLEVEVINLSGRTHLRVDLSSVLGLPARENLDLSPILRQGVKTHFSLNGELSHGIVT